MNWWQGSWQPTKVCRSGEAIIVAVGARGANLTFATRAPNKAIYLIFDKMSSSIPMTEVLVTADCWQAEPDAEAVIQRAVAAAAQLTDADVGDAELAVMLTDDAGIRTLNHNWRGIDTAPNVLSFPALHPTGP